MKPSQLTTGQIRKVYQAFRRNYITIFKTSEIKPEILKRMSQLLWILSNNALAKAIRQIAILPHNLANKFQLEGIIVNKPFKCFTSNK